MIISVFDREENIVGKGEIACTSNFSFSHNVFKRFLSQRTSKGVTVWEWVNPFPNKPLFLRVCSTSLLQTLWEKEKIAITNNNFYSHSILYPFRDISTIIMKSEIVVCILSKFGRI